MDIKVLWKHVKISDNFLQIYDYGAEATECVDPGAFDNSALGDATCLCDNCCGTISNSWMCWCDDLCIGYGDCCEDY